MDNKMDPQALTELLRASVTLHDRADLSPLMAKWHMGFVDSDFSGMRFTFSFSPEADMRNPLGTLHGGATAGILDTAMGVAARCFTRDQTLAVTAELNISYLRPVPLPATFHVLVTVLKTGAHLIYMRAEAFFPESPEQPLACAMGTFFGK